MKRRWFLAGLALPLVAAGCQRTSNDTLAQGPQETDGPDNGPDNGPDSGPDSGPLANVRRNNKTLVMATSANYPPYEQQLETDTSEAASDGKTIVGFDIDLAELIAARLDRKLTVVDLEFGALIPAVASDEVDMAMAALEPNRNRKQKVDFSNIYYRSQHTLISLDGYLRSRDLNYQAIGIRANSVQARYAGNLTNEIPDLDIVPYDTIEEIFAALDIGAIEGTIIEANVANTYLRRYPDFKGNIMPTEQATGSAIALPKNSPLTAKINTALRDIKASGDIDQLIAKWFS
jgi:polar amino acid transport system substrate-binding protein